MKERKRGTFWLGVMKAMPFLLVALCTAWTIARGGRLNVRQILSYTPDNYWLAAAVMLVLYAVKSLSVVFPLLGLFPTKLAASFMGESILKPISDLMSVV